MATRKIESPAGLVHVDPIQVQKAVLGDAEAVMPMFAGIFTSEITSADDLAFAGECLQTVKNVYKQVKGKRDEHTGPMLKTKQWIDGLYRPILQDLERKEARLKTMIAGYMQAEERKRLAEVSKAAEEAREAAEQARTQEEFEQAAAPVQAALQKAQAATVNNPKGISVGETWTWELVDGGAVPAEYWSIDPAKLTAAVKAGVREIPGVRIFTKATVRVRV